MWIKIALTVLLLLVILFVIVTSYGKTQWWTEVNNLHTEMQATQSQPGVTTFDPQELTDLPAPVQRYFSEVLKAGQPLIEAVNVRHTGTFNMGEAEDKWVPFTSTQFVTTRRPGFVWDARVSMAPGLMVFVNDAYVAGEGLLEAKILGVLTVMKQSGTSELAQGELLRFFAEMAWYPTAFLPSQGVLWEAIDDTQASATFSDGSTEVTVVITFDEQGLISTVYSDGRYRDVGGEQVLVPWEGRFRDYEWRDNMLVPLDGEVAWLLPGEPKPYWRGRIEDIEYTFFE